MGEQQMALQRAMPAPQTPTTIIAPPQAAAQGSQPQQGGQAPASEADMASIIAGMKGQFGLLKDPTQRPNEPVTAGLRSGPGPGPEVLQQMQGSPTGRTLREMSRLTGDPLFADLAAKAGM